MRQDCHGQGTTLLDLGCGNGIQALRCARHAQMTLLPKVEVAPTEWWKVLHLGAPAVLVGRSGVGVLGLADPPEDARIRLYWKD